MRRAWPQCFLPVFTEMNAQVLRPSHFFLVIFSLNDTPHTIQFLKFLFYYNVEHVDFLKYVLENIKRSLKNKTIAL